MNRKQLAAVFEKLKSSGKLNNPAASKIPMPASPKMKNPLTVKSTPDLLGKAPKNPDEVNPDYVGKGKRQRFRKLKNLFGA